MTFRNRFVVSDTHFGHANILKFLDAEGKHFRLFSSVEEMDELMVQRWNEKIRDQDIVYHLGDVYFGNGHRVLPRLRGHKRLILGNHDDGKDPILHHHFEKILMWRMFKDENCLLTHVPVHESVLFKVRYNLHGHIHEKPSPSDRHVNCSVEVQDYTPKTIEELVPH